MCWLCKVPGSRSFWHTAVRAPMVNTITNRTITIMTSTFIITTITSLKHPYTLSGTMQSLQVMAKHLWFSGPNSLYGLSLLQWCLTNVFELWPFTIIWQLRWPCSPKGVFLFRTLMCSHRNASGTTLWTFSFPMIYQGLVHKAFVQMQPCLGLHTFRIYNQLEAVASCEKKHKQGHFEEGTAKESLAMPSLGNYRYMVS